MAGNLSEALPHPLTFYYDLFATAHQMIFSRVHVTQKVKFSAMFNSDFNKFFAAVLEAHVEKHQDRKYAGKINLESQLFSSNQSYVIPKKEAPKKEEKPQVEKTKPAQEAPKAKAVQQKPQVELKAGERSKCTLLMLPPFSFSQESFAKLQSTFNVIEVNSADLKKDSAAAWATAQQSVNKKKTLVVISSFEGMG